ncbi:MAG: T9SS type A sorting domain-containing protein [Ignavibacteriaceae bacterium]
MKKLSRLIFLIVLTNILTYGQNQAAIEAHLILTDGIQTDTVFFGIDPTATDTLDFHLQEYNLPPIPPTGAYDFRLYLPVGSFSGIKSSWRDYRNGNLPFSGQVEHRIRFQRGSGDSLTLLYSFPSEIACDLVDLFGGVVVNTQLVGNGQYTIPNPDVLQQLKLLVNYINATDIEDENIEVSDYSLYQNYPNPFNPSTKIRYSVSSSQFIQLKIYDVLGKEVALLVNREQSAGTYEVNFDGKHLTSGIYFYSLKAGSFTDTKSMLLIK